MIGRTMLPAGTQCPQCGSGKLQPAKTTFELRAITMVGGPMKGQVNILVTPDGLDIMRCDDEICGETYFDLEASKKIDKASARARQISPGLMGSLELIRDTVKTP